MGEAGISERLDVSRYRLRVGASLDQSFRFKELRASCFKVKTKPSGTGWICAKNGLISSSPNLTVVLAEKPDRLGKLILGFPPRLRKPFFAFAALLWSLAWASLSLCSV
jgi:hypothetical protein